WQDGKALMLALRPLIRATATPSTPTVAATMPASQETELGLNLAEMQALVDIATDGVVILSPDAQIMSLNRSAEALFGYDKDHVIGKPFSVLFAIESRRAIEDYAS